MSNETKKTALPKLRFPEFEDAEEWKKKKLIDVTDKNVKWSFIGGPFGSNLQSSDYVPNGIRIIQLQNIGDGEFNDKYKIFTSKEKADELLSNNIYPGDIIMSKMGDPVGRACIIPDAHSRYVMCSDGIRVVVDKQRFSKYFVYSLINSTLFRPLVEKAATGSTRKRIGLDELKRISLLAPALEEQQKIAATLSSLDDLITAQNDKLAALQTHKRGLMQGLFPAEGETVPKLRFPEFQEAEEWEEKTLGEVSEIITGNTPSTADSDNYRGEKLFVSPADITGERFIFNTKVTLSEKGYSKTRHVKANSILFVCIGSTIGKIAQNKVECATNQQINAVVPKGSYVSDFIYSALENATSKITILAGRQAVPIINKSLFSSVKILFPGILEQAKIADTLSSLDNLITELTQKIEAFKLHKKGLLQSLFPAAAEPTA